MKAPGVMGHCGMGAPDTGEQCYTSVFAKPTPLTAQSPVDGGMALKEKSTFGAGFCPKHHWMGQPALNKEQKPADGWVLLQPPVSPCRARGRPGAAKGTQGPGKPGWTPPVQGTLLLIPGPYGRAGAVNTQS